MIGIVVAVGPGELNLKTGKREPLEFQVGDRVAYPLCVAEEHDGLHIFHGPQFAYGFPGEGTEVLGAKSFTDRRPEDWRETMPLGVSA